MPSGILGAWSDIRGHSGRVLLRRLTVWWTRATWLACAALRFRCCAGGDRRCGEKRRRPPHASCRCCIPRKRARCWQAGKSTNPLRNVFPLDSTTRPARASETHERAQHRAVALKAAEAACVTKTRSVVRCAASHQAQVAGSSCCWPDAKVEASAYSQNQRTRTCARRCGTLNRDGLCSSAVRSRRARYDTRKWAAFPLAKGPNLRGPRERAGAVLKPNVRRVDTQPQPRFVEWRHHRGSAHGARP